MEKILNIYKPLGMTTVQALEEFKNKNPEYQNISLAYTGRLDPMAEGVLVVLAGKERYNAKKYQKLNKEYLAKILFGFSTDSYDLLGIIKKESVPEVKKNDIEKILKKYEGRINLPLPSYSSYRIRGKPMFYLARKGELHKKDIPEKEMVVYETKLENFYEILSSGLHKYIRDTIRKVKGDFRQEEILANWERIFKKSEQKTFPLAEITFKVSGGTYIRSIADDIGKNLGIDALLYHLKRTQVGKFTEESSVRI